MSLELSSFALSFNYSFACLFVNPFNDSFPIDPFIVINVHFFMGHCFVDSKINNVTDSSVDALKNNVSKIAQPPPFKLKSLSIETRR